MKLLVERMEHGQDYTIGKLYIDGIFHCYTIEDQKNEKKVHGETRIPDGTYKVGTRWSPKFSPKTNHEMLWVKDVPGFEYILIHTGNTDDDTEGCLVLGKRLGSLNNQRAVLDSKTAYNEVYPIVRKAIDLGEEVTITYKSI